MSQHVEAFRGRTLYTYLINKKSARLVRQPGTSHIRVELPNGQRCGAVPPSDLVTKALMRKIAEALGMTYPELRADMGLPVIDKGKPRGKIEVSERVVGKSTALHTLNELIDLAETIKGVIYYGDRDPAIYARVHDSAFVAYQELNYVTSTDALLRQVAALAAAGSGD
jgi:hypothetical protein